ncbi:hypothetical protein [Lactobacillus panisapium]|uniref:Phage protein n=1 Tax=Lactobacillus panisapium TaxID=2012495 RepID=A0ABX8W889_9LACO|nr:hypothetical protein [Lactobacillus panisapium]QYN53081.1 hypothetical protein GYM71_06450 [Lactobacillus panisapium]
MTVTIKNKINRGWIVGTYKSTSGAFEPIFTDNKKAALEFDDLNEAIEKVKKLTNFSFDEFAFYENGKLMEVK